MKFRVIVSLFAVALLAFGTTLPSFAAPASNIAQADAVITDMAQAFKRGDRKRLTAGPCFSFVGNRRGLECHL